jgi:hypothetical protein
MTEVEASRIFHIKDRDEYEIGIFCCLLDIDVFYLRDNIDNIEKLLIIIFSFN